MISGPPPPPPPAFPRVTCTQDVGSGDEVSLEKVKATLRQQRVKTGVSVPPAPPLAASCPTAEEPDPDKVLEVLAHTRTCAIQNANSSEMLREVQASSPNRGTQTGKFRLRPDGQDDKEKST